MGFPFLSRKFSCGVAKMNRKENRDWEFGLGFQLYVKGPAIWVRNPSLLCILR